MVSPHKLIHVCLEKMKSRERLRDIKRTRLKATYDWGIMCTKWDICMGQMLHNAYIEALVIKIRDSQLINVPELN